MPGWRCARDHVLPQRKNHGHCIADFRSATGEIAQQFDRFSVFNISYNAAAQRHALPASRIDKMKNSLLPLALAVVLTGCATSNIAHKYQATPTPELTGTWIGTAAMQTHTMLIRPNGTGEVCWESMGKYNTMPMTISGSKIITQGASDLKRNTDGTFSQCTWGVCMDFKRTEQIPAACREWLKQ
jgi:hypothetical protein